MRVDTGRLWIYLLPVAALGVVAVGFLMLLVSPQERHDEEPVTLLLYCAVEARLPLEDITDSFQRRTGIRVRAQYAPSHLLLPRIERGQGDLFLSADDFYIRQARRQGLVEQGRPVAHVRPVLMVSTARPDMVHNVSDLTREGITVGLASPETTLGRITTVILQKNHVNIEHIEHVRVFSDSTATELAQAVELGQLDATIVWRPVAKRYLHQTRVIEIPSEHNVIPSLVAGVLTGSERTDAARQFVEFLAGNLSLDTFIKHDYDQVD